jgi:hypothetical protein
MTSLVISVALLGLAWPATALAQGELQGRIVAEDGRPVAGAELALTALGLRAVSDSAGRVRIAGIPIGEHDVVVRAVGYAPESTTVVFDAAYVLSREFTLRRGAQALAGVRVTGEAAPAPASEFEERRRLGVGQFVDRDVLAAASNRKLGDVLAAVPGVSVRRGGGRAWIASARGVQSGACAFCRTGSGPTLDPADRAAGARPACYMDVYLDGQLVFDSAARGGAPLFDINTLDPDAIEGIEVYTSVAQVPTRYNRTANGFGVMLIWTRRGR